MPPRSGPLAKRDLVRLTSALDRLPSEIAYLREPILAIAAQDQDLLGCGEADPTLLEEALRKYANADSGTFEPEIIADLLAQWTKSLARQNSLWAAPIWFVEGFLRGCEFTGLEQQPPAPRPKPILGLHHVALDAPKGMKTKLYNGGIELKNREAQIIVGELDDGSYRIRLEQ